MFDSDLPEFLEHVYLLETYYRVPTDKRLSRDESAGYFRQLRAFALDVVSDAAERLPGVYPSFFPKPGEWRTVCEQIAAERGFARKEQNEQAARSDFLRMVHCAHEFVIEPEPPGSFFTQFEVCCFCSLAKPTINRGDSFAKAAKYLAAGMGAK